MATASLRGKSVYPPTDTKVDSAETVGREVDGGRWETGGGEKGKGWEGDGCLMLMTSDAPA